MNKVQVKCIKIIMLKVNGFNKATMMCQMVKDMIKFIEEQVKVNYISGKQLQKINRNSLKLRKKIKSKSLLIDPNEVQIWLKNSSIKNKWSLKEVNSINL
jgi:hypothetical protein